MAKIGRNDACPCGSGKKYKRCHLAQDEDARVAAAKAARPDKPSTMESQVDDVLASIEAPPPLPQPSWFKFVPAILGVVGGLACVWASLYLGGQEALAIGAATLLAVGGWYIFSNPPPPDGGTKNPAGLDFGR